MKFDILKDFNVFAHNELIMKNADCEGVMAVHRNLVLDNFSVGVGYSPFECEREINSLVVGGKVKIKNSVNYNGNTCLQKNKFSNYYNMSNPSGRVVYKKLVDFERCFDDCVSIQSFLKNQKANTVVECNDYGKLNLKSKYSDDVLHFFVSSEDLNKADVVNFDIDISSRNLVFINVLGNRVDFSGVTILVNNKKCSCESTRNIFWNFVDKPEIIINNKDFYGTIFSTFGDLKCTNSRIFGNVYCNNIYGNSDIYLCKLSTHIVRYLNKIEDRVDCFNNNEKHEEKHEEKHVIINVTEKIEKIEKIEKLEVLVEENVKECIKHKNNYEKQALNLKHVKCGSTKNTACNEHSNLKKSLDFYSANLNKVQHSIGLLFTAEASKYEKALELATCLDDHLKINKSLIKTLKTIKSMQILVNERLESLEALKKLNNS